MKCRLFHILLVVVVMAFSVSCSYVMMNEGLDSEFVSDRSVTIEMALSTKAAAFEDTTPDKPTDLHVWVYSGDGVQPLQYQDFGNLNWIKADAGNGAGNIEYHIAISPIELTGLGEMDRELRVYALVNSGTVRWGNEDFATLSESQLKGQTFTEMVSSADDNSVPMYGSRILSITGEKDYYHTSIDVERCVAKMELYFTRSNPLMKLEIHKVDLLSLPDNGFLAPAAEGISGNEAKSVNVFERSGDTGVKINAHLGRNIPQGRFSGVYDNDNSTFDYFCWSYMMERDGMDWETTEEDDIDEIYREPEQGTVPNAYILRLEYMQGTEIKTKDLYLSSISRNTRYRIFIRMTEDVAAEVNSSTVPWIEGEGDHTIDVTPGLPVDGLNP